MAASSHSPFTQFLTRQRTANLNSLPTVPRYFRSLRSTETVSFTRTFFFDQKYRYLSGRQYEIRKKQLPKHLVFQRNEKAVRKCLQKKPQIPENSKKNQRSEMTIYRIKIKPICQVRSQNQTCAKILPMVSQEWGGYMGSLTNGYFSGKRPAKRRP